jgi:acyl-CoA reductase-like NAD-dependent aldehyde dehydrogenase
MITSTSIPTTSFERADAIATQLANHKDAWVELGILERITYLRRCLDGVMAIAELWAETACQAKGIEPNSSLAGEEWIAGPLATVRNLRLLIQALEAGGQPQPKGWRTRLDGQTVAQVFPENWMDRLLWMGFTAEVWIEPGQPPTQGAIYRESHDGKVALVLGAGNISSIASMDTLYKLFVEDQVVVLKMNPVNEYVGPLLEQAFQSLQADGFFDVVYGGAELGSYLCQHPQIDTVHITGSYQTHDAIVWGSTLAEQKQRKAAQKPLLSKLITSELGCVTPVLVVPGSWSQADIVFQARHVASMVAHNASFNCTAAKVIVTAKGWKQRQAFLTQLHRELAAIPARQAYYPGAQQRYQRFLEHYPQAQALAPRTEQSVPWTVSEVSPELGEYALTHEAFCGVLAEVALEAVNAPEFLTQAVEFANQKIWGTLSCNLLIDPVTEKSCAVELEEAIANLRYGGIGVNVWTGVVYLMGIPTWGAFPGQSLTDIGSGRGVVHNTYLFDHPQKSVVRAPFRIRPTPVWFANHRNLLQLAKRLIAFEAAPAWNKLPGVFIAALKG